jgi:hypothetical protein
MQLTALQGVDLTMPNAQGYRQALIDHADTSNHNSKLRLRMVSHMMLQLYHTGFISLGEQHRKLFCLMPVFCFSDL